MKKKKRRKLKLWVKNTLLILLLLILLALVIIYIFKDNTPKITKEKIISLTKKEEKNFYYEELSSSIKTKITGKTFPKEFDSHYQKITYDDLRYIKIKYYDFEGIIHNDGELIVHKEVAEEVLDIFYKLYKAKYPFTKIKLVDEYNGNDELSMQDNNTSAFNYRLLEDSTELSWHAFGIAIDINPLYNPYILGNKIYPSTAKDYTNRNQNFKGKIDHNDLAYKLFTEQGWKWGGDFQNSKDYQHFYKEIFKDEIRRRK